LVFHSQTLGELDTQQGPLWVISAVFAASAMSASPSMTGISQAQPMQPGRATS
jgi:hypothetical protein